MNYWTALEEELNRWEEEGRVATFWWRDDDLNEPTEALDRLLSLRSHFGIPLTLAVIPDRVDPVLADLVDGCHVVQHGVFHRNFAEEGEKKSEFPPSRDDEEVLEDILQGQARLKDVFEEDFLPVFVPPWNRIDDAYLAGLTQHGFVGLSRYKSRRFPLPVPGLAEVNTHVDPIFWKGDRGAVPEQDVLRLVTEHLMARRQGLADPWEPTGLLTHHLVHNEDVWTLCFKLLDFLNARRAVRWLTLPGAMALIDDFPGVLPDKG
ncbi:polysaccharide deacetylase family protein [Sneathiella chinensis]|uniref:Polysaccharide deacetylase n=1 Tax=Sneathiella chinensis TaxID=349750 RepID=A0ABQ5TZD7_9PROT|nr:polysaccharide deacetylase family protein [Sneathiella chinensis]GLQ05235.1 polysaccharide deacetylase [Sneathiella chinensis]